MCNLQSFVVPNDAAFIALVEALDTPKKISCYMCEHFTYKAHLLYSPNPYILWKIGEGDCNDFATFGIFMAHTHGYETYMIELYYSDTKFRHAIAVYIEDMMSITDNQWYAYGFESFEDIVCRSSHYSSHTLAGYVVRDYEGNTVEEGDGSL
jgi:hypothetical protein